MKELLKKCLVEFIGTFFLVLTVGLTACGANATPMAPIAIGIVLAVMIYAGGHVSGAHYNPAVSLAAAIRGALEWKDILHYWVAQLAGGAVAAWAVVNFTIVNPVPEADICICSLILFEFLFTFALCYVVLHTATSKATEGNSYFGFAIGATVLVGAFASAGICYGAFNPAVALGLLTMSVASAKLIGITALTNLVAGAAAAGIFKITD